MDGCKNWEGLENYEDYILNWAMIVCVAGNKSNNAKTSQLGTLLLEIDVANKYFENWADARITQTIGQRQSGNAGISRGDANVNGKSTTNVIVQPIVYITMQQISLPMVDEMDLAFHCGADSQKHRTETTTLTGTKYTDKHLVHLMGFCGLASTTKDQLPEIWKNLQPTKH